MFKVLKKEGTACRGVFETVHGTVQTPAFMNVATCAAIKGAVSAFDMADDLHTQVMLCNTYHLHLRPGDELIKKGEKQVEVLVAEDKWYGMTYKEDTPVVKAAIAQMTKDGLYDGI